MDGPDAPKLPNCKKENVFLFSDGRIYTGDMYAAVASKWRNVGRVYGAISCRSL